MAHIHEWMRTQEQDLKFDPIQYKLDEIPNPRRGVVYRDNEANKYVLFVPTKLDRNIRHVSAFRLNGRPVAAPVDLGTGTLHCAYFQGKTGMTETHRTAGWTSFLGAVIYDPQQKRACIVFRGSRSGSATRALLQAQAHSRGNPDWVTDMDLLKGIPVPELGNSTLAVGFHLAYQSCTASLAAAWRHAVGVGDVDELYITGHSLGGALATLAYVDFACGPRRTLLAGANLGCKISCYPMSAPQICHELSSHHWLSRNAGASNICHFYCPNDAVHGGPLVEGSYATRLSRLTGMRHAFTTPLHLGSETAVDNNVSFPAAHAVPEVLKGMIDGPVPPRFWPEFTMDLGTRVPAIAPPAGCTVEELKEALGASYDPLAYDQLARDWMMVIRDPARFNEIRENVIMPHLRFITGFEEIGNDHSRAERRRGAGRAELAALARIRHRIFDVYQDQISHHVASGSAVYVVLLSMAVQRFLI